MWSSQVSVEFFQYEYSYTKLKYSFQICSSMVFRLAHCWIINIIIPGLIFVALQNQFFTLVNEKWSNASTVTLLVVCIRKFACLQSVSSSTMHAQISCFSQINCHSFFRVKRTWIFFFFHGGITTILVMSLKKMDMHHSLSVSKAKY